MPRVRKVDNVAPSRPVIDATEQKIGQDTVREFADTATPELTVPVVEPVEGPNAKEKAEALAFMEEMVDVLVHESSNPDDIDPIVSIHVNGRTQNFIRGQTITVKRKYLEGLARAKPMAVRSEEFTLADGSQSYRYPTKTGLRYGFQVERDDNPAGRAWLKKVLAEG